VLVCDGPALLAWVGCFREEPFTRADSGLLRELVPAIQNRLRIENYLQTQPLYLSALRAALDAIPGEAFVVSTAGGRLSVIEANLIGRAALDGVRRATLDDLRRSLAGTAAAPYLVKELASPGIPHHSLAVRHTPRLGDQTALRLRLAQTRWELSPKQAAVLRHLAAGDANKTIATKLVLAEVTVEKHVTAVLMKAAVDSRAALIAAFWSQRLDG